MKHRFAGIDPGWLVAALLPLVGILPTLNNGSVAETADGLFHVHRIFAMTELMAAGNLYPRWIPWFHLGYGYPVFNFYAPAASYIGGLLGLLGISAPVAYALILAGSWVGGSLGIYALARRFLPAGSALVAAALWSYAPPRLQDVWNIGNLSQLIGAALLPWLFLALSRAVEHPGRRCCAGLGLAFGALILAHQPTTLLAALFIIPGLPLMCLWAARHDRDTLLTRLICASGGLALGVGLSLVFTLPLFLELPYIKVSLPATDIPGVLLSNFLTPDQLFAHPAAPDLSDLSRRLPDTLGLVGGVFGLLGFIALLWKRRYGLALAWGAALAFSLFLMLEVSFGLWLTVPLLDQLRFPARVLRAAAVFLALAGGASLLLLPCRYQELGAGILLVIIIGLALPTIYPSRDWVDFSGLSARSEIEYELETFAFGGTSYNEFKPIWAVRTPFDQPPDTEGYAAHPMRISWLEPDNPAVQIQRAGDSSFRVQTPASFELSLRHFYFPGWSAWVDGSPAETFPKSDFGLLTLNVPAGDHTIQLAYTGTPVQNLAPFLTLLSLALVALLYRQGHPSESAPDDRLQSSFAALTAAALVGFATFNALYIAPQTEWFRQRSPLDSPAAMRTPVHVTFGDAYELLGYTLDAETAVPGGAFRITLYWRALRPLERFYRPQVQLVNPRLTEAWGSSEGFFVGSSPTEHTPDYFVSDVHSLRLFDDAPPYVASITVRLIDDQTGEPLPLPDGSDRLTLDQTVRVTVDTQPVRKAFDYRFGGAVELWCASVIPLEESLRLDVYWHVHQPPGVPELRAFVHGLDAAGDLVAQADAPPLDGDYSPAHWLPGQTLADSYLLPNDPAISQIAVGLYIPGGERLPLLNAGQPVPENRVLLPVETRDCKA